MRDFKIMAIVTLLVSAVVSVCWTKFYFYLHPMALLDPNDSTTDWAHVAVLFAHPFVLTFFGGIILGSIPWVAVKLFKWLKKRLVESPPLNDSSPGQS